MKLPFRLLQKKLDNTSTSGATATSLSSTTTIGTSFAGNLFKSPYRLTNTTALVTSSTVILLTTMYIIKKQSNAVKYKIHKNIPSAVPKFFQISSGLEILYMLCKSGVNFRKFNLLSIKKLNTNIFKLPTFFAGDFPGEIIAVLHPADQEKVYKKEKMMEVKVAMPDSVTLIHGANNLQNLQVGSMHSAIRKIYSSILSPKAMESFIPYMISYFDKMWKDLEIRTKECKDEDLPQLRLAIRDCQLKVMCHILFGMTYDSDEEQKEYDQFCHDFELTEKALFADTKSKTHKEGMDAKARIFRILSEKFDKIYEERVSDFMAQGNEKENEKKIFVGNAMVIIADALIKHSLNDASNKNEDGSIAKSNLYDIARENLYLLLEASHGTTMHITTALMFFLNDPDNAGILASVRKEISAAKVGGDDAAETEPNYEFFKTKMILGDACIYESLRLAPIAGGVILHVAKGKKMELRNYAIEGPVNFALFNSHWYDDPETFPQPNQFLPQRWIEGDANEASAFAKSTFKPFGDGRHICLGMHLAKLVMKVNLYCFAKEEKRAITYDFKKVKLERAIFPETKVSDNFLVRVHQA